MSFADTFRSEREPLQASQHSQYGGIHSDQVDRVETRPINGLDWLHSLPEGSGRISDFMPQDMGSDPIKVAAPLEQSSEPVRKEAMKVNWSLFGKLLACIIVPGLAYLAYVGIYNLHVAWHNWGIEESATPEDSIRLQRPGISVPSQVKASKRKKEEPPFGPHEERIPQQLFAVEREVQNFCENKQALGDQAQDIVRKKTALQDRQRELEDLIPEVKAMWLHERLKAGHPSSKELQKELDAIPAKIQELQSQAHYISRQLRADCLQHPEFAKVSNSRSGFPFRIYFGREHLPQEQRYMGLIIGGNDQFNMNLNEKLMSWAGVRDIDPFSTSAAARVQDVLVRLTRGSDEPLVLKPEERRLSPRTIGRTLEVRFETGRKLVIERQVQTRDGKRYQWVETIRFGGGEPIASRRVTEIRE